MRRTGLTRQTGAGLVEVLVSILLVALGVLGFVGLQTRAVGASTEAVQRTQAINLISNLSQRIQVNAQASADYANLLKPDAAAVSETACGFTSQCTAAQLASADVGEVKRIAKEFGMLIFMEPCLGLTEVGRQCVFVLWGSTTKGYGDSDASCMTRENVYQPRAECLMLETL